MKIEANRVLGLGSAYALDLFTTTQGLAMSGTRELNTLVMSGQIESAYALKALSFIAALTIYSLSQIKGDDKVKRGSDRGLHSANSAMLGVIAWNSINIISNSIL